MHADNDKVVCRTPTPNKLPTRIERWKYDLMRRILLQVVPNSGKGVLFADLPALVSKKISTADRKRLGSLNWYLTTVKLELEVAGILRRIPDGRRQRLLRN